MNRKPTPENNNSCPERRPTTVCSRLAFRFAPRARLKLAVGPTDARRGRFFLRHKLTGPHICYGFTHYNQLEQKQMKGSPHMDPYLRPGRLADVIAAIQVTASAKRPERKIEDWAFELDRSRDTPTIARWSARIPRTSRVFHNLSLAERGRAEGRVAVAIRL